jgi:hypothetical protein
VDGEICQTITSLKLLKRWGAEEEKAKAPPKNMPRGRTGKWEADQRRLCYRISEQRKTPLDSFFGVFGEFVSKTTL